MGSWWLILFTNKTTTNEKNKNVYNITTNYSSSSSNYNKSPYLYRFIT